LKGVYANHIRRQNLIMAGLKSVGLSEISNWYPDQLSGSMKRRLALLRAFLYPSKLLLMDEPFTGLDINVKQNIINLFLCLWQKDKRTVVFVSHDLDESLLVANHIYVMSQKPMQLLQMVNINQPHSKRTLYHQPIIKTKKVITDLIKLKW
jgi:NitT/TauT family transport system ATP-binding protein